MGIETPKRRTGEARKRSQAKYRQEWMTRLKNDFPTLNHAERKMVATVFISGGLTASALLVFFIFTAPT